MTAKLGEGAYSTVFKGLPLHREASWYKVAIKEISTTRLGKNVLSELQNEMNILSQLQHNCIVRLYKVYIIPDKFFLVMEYLKGGELLNAICKRELYTENDAKRVVVQVMSALSYLHARKVIHRDLKPENLILATRSFGSPIKLVDFGFAMVLEPGTDSVVTSTHCGTPGYMAPEILSKRSYSTSVDMWSFGVVLYILMSGLMPFNSKRKDLIMAGIFTFPEQYWLTVSDSAKDLICKLLRVDPIKRLTAEEVLLHPWLTSTTTTPTGPSPSPSAIPSTIMEEVAGVTASSQNSYQSRHSKNSENGSNDGNGNGSGSRNISGSTPLVPSKSSQFITRTNSGGPGGGGGGSGNHPGSGGTSSPRAPLLSSERDAMRSKSSQSQSEPGSGDLTGNLVEIRRYLALRKFRLSALVLKGASKFKNNMLRRKSSPDAINDLNMKSVDDLFKSERDSTIDKNETEKETDDGTNDSVDDSDLMISSSLDSRGEFFGSMSKSATIGNIEQTERASFSEAPSEHIETQSGYRPRSISAPGITSNMLGRFKDRFTGSESDDEQDDQDDNVDNDD